MMPMLLLEEKQSASNRTPRQINRNVIFNQVRMRQPISRAELARVSGLQRSTVSLIVEELLRERWIVEGLIGDAPRGRKPTGLHVNEKRTVLAVDVHPAQTTLAVADLSGRITTQRELQLPSEPQKVIRAIVSGIKKIIAEHADCSFEGIGLTVPGRFSHQLKKTIFAPNVGWPIAQIKSKVEEATGLPVVVDNVANACVLSEVWFGSTEEMHDIVLVNVSEGIGTGIFVNGGLVRGAGEMAGEFGHVQIDRDGIPCGCGSRGCWETLASNRAGLRYYKEITGESLPSIDVLLDLAEKKDPHANEALTRMFRALGQGLHMIVTTLAPSQIVLVGEFTRAWARACSIISDELRKFPLPALPMLRMATEPGTARLRGGVALVMSEKLL
ncbi:ROK family protein [Occallatibacter savannae]|uniref:ROK family protein n=1 Tax=Occallatibacter savannae TaxID=1002691 RepID=UPI00195188D1|nr:ROK family protein [Occallatibacter savannae]